MTLLAPVLALAAAAAPCERQTTTTLLPVSASTAVDERGSLLLQENRAKNGVLSLESDVTLEFDLLGALPQGLAPEDLLAATLSLVARGDLSKGVTVTGEATARAPAGGAAEPVPFCMRRVVPGEASADRACPSMPDQRERADLARDLPLLCEPDPGEPARLLAAARGAFKPGSRLVVRLSTRTSGAKLRLHGPADADPTNAPRLVVEYCLGRPTPPETMSWAQSQHDPEHSGRSAWAGSGDWPPRGYDLVRIEPARLAHGGSIEDRPLLHRGNLHVIYSHQSVLHLLALDPNGTERWHANLGVGTVQSPPAIGRNGALYLATEERIAVFDLNALAIPRHVPPGDDPAPEPTHVLELAGQAVVAGTDLTVGDDGSLFVALKSGDQVYLHGLQRGPQGKLRPFLKLGPLATGGARVSTSTLTADGRWLAIDTPAGARFVDLRLPARRRSVCEDDTGVAPSSIEFRVPVAGPAAPDGAAEGPPIVFADLTRGVRATSCTGEEWWKASGTPAQPALGQGGVVYVLQGRALWRRGCDGRLRRVEVATITPPSASVASSWTAGERTAATSNLVLDGADRVYFWDRGTLRGYAMGADPRSVRPLAVRFQRDPDSPSAGKDLPAPAGVPARLVARRTTVDAGPEKNLQLMIGPDGTIWANNQGEPRLYAFIPRLDGVVKTPRFLASGTCYRAAAKLEVPADALVPKGARVLLQAGASVSLSKKFTVAKGGSVLVRTGF